MDNLENRNKSEQVIVQYQQDEQMMIRLFIDWCRSNDIDPSQVYATAYPTQSKNDLLHALIEEATDEEPINVPTATLLDALQMFGNEALAFVIAELAQKIEK